MVKIPRNPLSKEAQAHFKDKVKRMHGIEKEKMIKRLEMADRGFIKKGDGIEFAEE